MNQQKVYLSVGRHGISDMVYGIMNISMLDAYFSAKKLKVFGKCLILCSPLERAVVTAKIRREVLNCELIILEELSQNNFCYLKPSEELLRTEELKEKIFQTIREGEYEHIHIITHMPVMDVLHLPVCDECEYVVIEAASWGIMQELLNYNKIPYHKGKSSRPDTLNFLKTCDEISDCTYSRFLSLIKKYDI